MVRCSRHRGGSDRNARGARLLNPTSRSNSRQKLFASRIYNTLV